MRIVNSNERLCDERERTIRWIGWQQWFRWKEWTCSKCRDKFNIAGEIRECYG